MFNKAAVFLFKRELGIGQLKDIFNCCLLYTSDAADECPAV